MGALFFFDEELAKPHPETGKCQVEVLDNHGFPEVRIGPEGEAYKGWSAYFTDWEQFERFAEAVESVRSRLGSSSR